MVIGPLMLVGLLPVAAGQATFGLGSGGAPIQLVDNASTTDRDTYLQQARADMHDWEQKLRDFSAKVDAKGQKVDNAADNDLNRAWTETQDASNRLQTASAQDWQSARISYEKATRDLANAWDKIRPEDK